MKRKRYFFLALALLTLLSPLLWPAGSRYLPGLALLAGLVFALCWSNPLAALTGHWTPRLLGWSVIGIGFGMNLVQVLKAGLDGFLYTVIGIAAGLTLGLVLGRRLRVPGDCACLIAVGTSICGGSAIAAVAPVLKAKNHDIAIALATVFVLNGVALLLFPPLGHAFGFSQHQFGLWAALAIHDTSSVVGASYQYGPEALATGTTVKLARALWIVVVTLIVAALVSRTRRTPGEPASRLPIKVPWFIPGFLLAATLMTLAPQLAPVGMTVKAGAQALMVMTLFLIGAGLSLDKVRKLGWRPLALGVVLWAILACGWGWAIGRHWVV